MFKRNDGKGINSVQNRFTALLKKALHNHKVDYIIAFNKKAGKEVPLSDYTYLIGDESDFIDAIVDYATLLLENGASLSKISAVLGHSSINTTFEYYCDISDEGYNIKAVMDDNFVPTGAA